MAQIWAPTQIKKNYNWDYGAKLGDGKIFILEDKATEEIPSNTSPPVVEHRIEIWREQLDWYCEDVETEQDAPVFYVLPKTPWTNPLSLPPPAIPQETLFRVSNPQKFVDWAYAVRCHDLRNYLISQHKNGDRPGIKTSVLPFGGCKTLAVFLAEVRECSIGTIVRESVKKKSQSEIGVSQRTSQAEPPNFRPTDLGRETSSYGKSALAVFISAEQLPNFGAK